MESYWDSEEEDKKPKHLTWEVIQRNILFSGPNATEMDGIVILIVQALNLSPREGDTDGEEKT